jgi:hypothetical protein
MKKHTINMENICGNKRNVLYSGHMTTNTKEDNLIHKSSKGGNYLIARQVSTTVQ